MRLEEAVVILNERRHRDFSEWTAEDIESDLAIAKGDAYYDNLSAFEAIAVATAYLAGDDKHRCFDVPDWGPKTEAQDRASRVAESVIPLFTPESVAADLGVGPGQELLPCPFCGLKDAVTIEAGTHRRVPFYSIFCRDCEAQGPTVDAQSEAAEAWNHRAPAWISVEDRLPSQMQDVTFVIAEDCRCGLEAGRVVGGRYIADGYTGFGIFGIGGLPVKLWQPSPSPPEVKR